MAWLCGNPIRVKVCLAGRFPSTKKTLRGELLRAVEMTKHVLQKAETLCFTSAMPLVSRDCLDSGSGEEPGGLLTDH